MLLDTVIGLVTYQAREDNRYFLLPHIFGKKTNPYQNVPPFYSGDFEGEAGLDVQLLKNHKEHINISIF